jgi:histone deacetylase complex regulatory component SIN3
MTKSLSALTKLFEALSELDIVIAIAAVVCALIAFMFYLWISKRGKVAKAKAKAALEAAKQNAQEENFTELIRALKADKKAYQDELKEHRADRNQWYDVILKMVEESKEAAVRTEEVITQANTLHVQILHAVEYFKTHHKR